MRARPLLAGLAVFVVLVACLLVRSRDDADLRYYSPTDYVRRANELIQRGFLKADCEGVGTRIVTDWEGATELDQEWYDDSYLKTDVARFNEDPDRYGWTFVIDNDCRLLAVNEIVHNVELPFSTSRPWLGRIFYSGKGSDASLRSARRAILLRRPTEPVPAVDERTATVGGSQQVDGEVVRLQFDAFLPAARLYHVGDAVVLNNRVKEAGQGEVRLLGRHVPAGRIAWLETGDWLHFAGGRAAETFVYTVGEARPVASTVRLRNARYHRETEDDRLGWIADPVRGWWRPYLDALAGSVDRVLSRLPEERTAALGEAFDLQLTIDRDLQSRLNQVMHDHFARLAQQPEVRDDFEAGITVLDGGTGDVLAAFTYPWPEDLADSTLDDERSRQRRLLNQNWVRHPIGSAVKPFLFAAVANRFPFLLGMTIDEHPAEDRHHELFHCWMPLGYQLLGGHFGTIDFRRALEISCNKYDVELVTLALAAEKGRLTGGGELLALKLPGDDTIDWPPPAGSGVRVGGRELDYAPDLSGFLLELHQPPPADAETTAVLRCEMMDRLDLAAFRLDLERLTGASTYRGKAPQNLPQERDAFYSSYLTNRYDLRPWRALLAATTPEAGDEHAWPVRAALQDLSPERVNLAFNNITDLRRDWISLALGGASSTWTNLQAAEAMSRLVTGRRIEVKLIDEVIPRRAHDDDDGDEEAGAAAPGPEAAPAGQEEDQHSTDIELRPEVRQAVLEGMARVVSGTQGTARPLRPALARLRGRHRHDTILLFSKTGSPVLMRPTSAVTGRALDRLVPRHLSLTEDGRVRVTVGSQQVVFDPRQGRRAFSAALERALQVAGFGRGQGALAWRVMRIVERFSQQREALSFANPASVPEEIDGPLYAVGGQLATNRSDPLFTRSLIKTKGAVYLFSLVRAPREVGLSETSVPSPEQLADPRVQVVTVALHLTVGPDSKIAVEAASHLLDNVELLD